MADEEVVLALNGLSKTTQKLVDDRIADAEEADKDRKKQIYALNKQIKAGDGRTREIIAARGQRDQLLQEAKEATKLSKDVSTEQFVEAIKANSVDQFQEQRNQLEILRATLEANGQVATDSKEFNKLQYEIQKAELAERLKNADSPAARKEIKNEQRALAAKQEGLLGKIAGGIGSLRDSAKEKLKSAGKGVMTLLKGFAIAGFALALIAFLNSPLWEDTKKYIMDVAIPKLKEFYNAFFGEGGGFINGIKTLFGDESGMGSIVIGIASATALFAAFKFAKLISAVKGLLGGVGSFASKITGIGGDKGLDPRGKNQRASKAPRKGGGGGFGGMIANIAKGIGKGAVAILRSLATGLKFFTPQVLIGAGILGGSILAIGAGIAGAAWLTGAALPKFTAGLRDFETLDGAKLLLTAGAVAALGGALAALGAGTIVSSIGNVVGSIGAFFTGDKETPLEQLKKFGDTKINTVQATANANALVAYSKAMAAAGGASAAEGIGDFVSGTLGSLGNFFAGEKKVDPLSQLKEFGETKINSEQVIANADAMVAYSKAMVAGSAGTATGGLATFASGVLGSIGKFFGGEDVDPLSQLKKFGETVVNSEQVISNANAMIAYSKAMSAGSEGLKTAGFASFVSGVMGSLGKFFGGGEAQDPLSQLKKFGDTTINSANVTANAKAMGAYATAMSDAKNANPTLGEGVSGFITGALGGLASFFGKDSPLEKLKKFGEMDISSEGVIKNAKAMADYTKAISGLSATGKSDLDFFTDSVLKMKEAIDSLSSAQTAQGLRLFGKATKMFGGIDTKDIKKLNEEGLSIPVNVVGKAMVEMSAGLSGGGGTVVVNAPSTNVNSSSQSSASFTNTNLRAGGSAGNLALQK